MIINPLIFFVLMMRKTIGVDRLEPLNPVQPSFQKSGGLSYSPKTGQVPKVGF
jgi:hypothetical protein